MDTFGHVAARRTAPKLPLRVGRNVHGKKIGYIHTEFIDGIYTREFIDGIVIREACSRIFESSMNSQIPFPSCIWTGPEWRAAASVRCDRH